jgi:hypothetical protein
MAATEHAVCKMITWKPSFNGNVALSRCRRVACLVEEMLAMAFSGMKEHMKATTVPMKENIDRKEKHSYYMSIKRACKVV